MINFAKGKLKLPEITLNPGIKLEEVISALKDKITVKEIWDIDNDCVICVSVVYKNYVMLDENPVLIGLEFTADGALIKYVLCPITLPDLQHLTNEEFDAWAEYLIKKGKDAGMVPSEEYSDVLEIPGFLQGDACSINMEWLPLLEVYVRHSTKE